MHYYSVRKDDRLSHTAALRVTAKRLGYGVDSVKRAVSSYEEHRKIVVYDGTGRSGSSHSKLDHDTEIRLAKKLQELRTTSTVTTVDLQEWLKSEADNDDELHKDRVPVEVTTQTVRGWLKRMGYEFLEGKWLYGHGTA